MSTSSSGEVKLNPGKVRNGWDPNAARPIASAVTELSTTNPKDSVSKVRRISSNAKNTPAIGRVERRRDLGGGTARDEQPQPRLVDREHHLGHPVPARLGGDRETSGP